LILIDDDINDVTMNDQHQSTPDSIRTSEYGMLSVCRYQYKIIPYIIVGKLPDNVNAMYGESSFSALA
jgi:hypothetical protein